MKPDNWQARLVGVERELSYIEDPQQRRDLLATAERAARGGWRRFFVRIAAMAVELVAIGLLLAYVATLAGNRAASTAVATSIAVLVGPAILGTIPLFLYRREVQRSVREQIRALGIPLCLHCGYNLARIASTRCPECGAAAN